MNSNDERLDRIERKVDEIKNKEIFQLRQDRVELKNIFFEMKNQQQQMTNRNNIPNFEARVLPESNYDHHQKRIKRPF